MKRTSLLTQHRDLQSAPRAGTDTSDLSGVKGCMDHFISLSARLFMTLSVYLRWLPRATLCVPAVNV